MRGGQTAGKRAKISTRKSQKTVERAAKKATRSGGKAKRAARKPNQTFYPEYSSKYPLLVKFLMDRPLDNYPDDTAIVYQNSEGVCFRFTWRQWYARTCQQAHALKALGAKRGDRIGTLALNSHRHLENIWATVCSGAIAHPINIRLSMDHMAFTITHAEDKIIFFDDVLLPLVDALYDRIKSKVKKFVYMSDRPGLPNTRIKPLYEYEELIGNRPTTYDWPDFSEDTHATLYYTTGTTGLPKGILYTHRQIVLQSFVYASMGNSVVTLPTDPPRPNQAIPLFIIPLYHIHAWGFAFSLVAASAKIVVPGKYTPENFCELVQNEKVNSCFMVPVMLAMLLEYPDIEKWDLSSLISVSVGGGALPIGLKKKAEKRFPNLRTGSGYGMSETLGGAIGATLRRHMADWPKEELDKIYVKTGLPYTGVKVRVIDEKGRDVPRDNKTIGEIVLRGFTIMEQYYKDPKRTAASWRGGWFHTGDLAKVDRDGYITIADRKTDVIRSGSEMVPTVLLENLTSNAEYVLEAAYVGVPDEKWGEVPMALVKVMPGSDKKEEDIINFLQAEGVDQGKITKWMLPVYVAFVDDIPRTSVGKYDKIDVRRRLEEFKSKARKVR